MTRIKTIRFLLKEIKPLWILESGKLNSWRNISKEDMYYRIEGTDNALTQK
jgi:hypothetical protein